MVSNGHMEAGVCAQQFKQCAATCSVTTSRRHLPRYRYDQRETPADQLSHMIGTELERADIVTGAGFTINSAAFVNFEPGNEFIYQLVQRFTAEFRGQEWGWNGPGLITRTWQHAGDALREEINLASKDVLCPVGWHELWKFFSPLKDQEDVVRTVNEKSCLVHLWQSLGVTAQMPYADENSTVGALLSFACPATHEMSFLRREHPTIDHGDMKEMGSQGPSPVRDATLEFTTPRIGSQYGQFFDQHQHRNICRGARHVEI